MRFKFLEHTADIKFRAYGKDLNEAFENAALAMFESITDTSKVGKLYKEEIVIKAEDRLALLYDFLEELLILHETKDYLFSRFNVKIEGNTLWAIAWGEKIGNYETRNLIKAITYNEMLIEEGKDKTIIQAVIDI